MATNRDKHVPCVHRLILSSSLFFSLVLSAMHPVRKNMMNTANTGNAQHWTCSNRGGSMTSFHPQNSPTGGKGTSIQPLRLAYYSIRNMQVQHVHILKEATFPETIEKKTVHWTFNHHLFILPKVEVYQFIQWLKWEKTNPLLPQRCIFFLQPTHQPTYKDPSIITS